MLRDIDIPATAPRCGSVADASATSSVDRTVRLQEAGSLEI
jgi:hypothetical protein